MQAKALFLALAVGASFALIAQAAMAGEAASAPAQPASVSPAVAPALKSVQNAIKAKDFNLAAIELAKAEAMPNKSAFDENVIGQFRKMIDLQLSRAAKPR